MFALFRLCPVSGLPREARGTKLHPHAVPLVCGVPHPQSVPPACRGNLQEGVKEPSYQHRLTKHTLSDTGLETTLGNNIHLSPSVGEKAVAVRD